MLCGFFFLLLTLLPFLVSIASIRSVLKWSKLKDLLNKSIENQNIALDYVIQLFRTQLRKLRIVRQISG